MTELNKENADDWKEKLRSAFISAFSGNPQENIQVYTEVGYYYMCCAPSSLYKYYSDRQEKLETVKHNKMWYSAPCNFNDVFDCDMSMDEEGIFQSILQMYPDKRGIREGSPIWRDLLKTCRQQIRTFQSSYDILKSRVGISCLSESDDSLLMWAHYDNNHCGICVEYELLEINRQLGFSPVPIIYSDDRVCIHTLDPNTLEKDIQGIFIESLTSKSPEWSYEKEWRIIRDDGACGNKWDAEKKGALLEMIRPSSIILGCMAKPEFEKAVREHCEECRINLYKMKKDKGRYRLEKVPVILFDD